MKIRYVDKEAVMKYALNRPGCTARNVADDLGYNPRFVGCILADLHRDGKVKKLGRHGDREQWRAV